MHTLNEHKRHKFSVHGPNKKKKIKLHKPHDHAIQLQILFHHFYNIRMKKYKTNKRRESLSARDHTHNMRQKIIKSCGAITIDKLIRKSYT